MGAKGIPSPKPWKSGSLAPAGGICSNGSLNMPKSGGIILSTCQSRSAALMLAHAPPGYKKPGAILLTPATHPSGSWKLFSGLSTCLPKRHISRELALHTAFGRCAAIAPRRPVLLGCSSCPVPRSYCSSSGILWSCQCFP